MKTMRSIIKDRLENTSIRKQWLAALLIYLITSGFVAMLKIVCGYPPMLFRFFEDIPRAIPFFSNMDDFFLTITFLYIGFCAYISFGTTYGPYYFAYIKRGTSWLIFEMVMVPMWVLYDFYSFTETSTALLILRIMSLAAALIYLIASFRLYSANRAYRRTIHPCCKCTITEGLEIKPETDQKDFENVSDSLI